MTLVPPTTLGQAIQGLERFFGSQALPSYVRVRVGDAPEFWAARQNWIWVITEYRAMRQELRGVRAAAREWQRIATLAEVSSNRAQPELVRHRVRVRPRLRPLVRFLENI